MPLFRRRASMLAVLLSVAALAALIIWVVPNGQRQQAPALEFALLDGSKITLAELHDQPVLLVFWSITCSTCVEEIPDLVRLHESLSPRGFALIAVAMPYDPPALVKEFVIARRLPYAIAIDVPGRAAKAFSVAAIPTAVLIDGQGRVVWQHTGRLDLARTRRQIESLLPSG